MINITINQIVNLFKQWSENHPQLNDFGFGPVWDFGVSREMQYPAMWMDFNTSSTYLVSRNNITPTYSFIFMFLDKENIQENVLDENGYMSNNVSSIMSDMEQICRDLLRFLNNPNHKIKISVEGNVTINKVVDETQDKVYGFAMYVTIRSPFNICSPTTPIEDINLILTNNNEIIIASNGDDIIF